MSTTHDTPNDPDATPAVTSAAAGNNGARPNKLDSDPTEAWPQLYRRLTAVLHQRIEGPEFLSRLAFIEERLNELAHEQQDESVLVLVQMLSDRQYSYCATHALLAALMCTLMGPLALIEGDRLRALVRAALTMNIGMAELQDLLALQTTAPDGSQRERIESHPQRGVDILREWGVTDDYWLQLVADHHEAPDGSGYPSGKKVDDPVLQCLRLADLFVAKISPRATRRGLLPNVAVGTLYLQVKEQDSQLGAIFVKQLGMYPPGTYVRLKNDETAIVVRRGERVNTPHTMAIADANGMPLSVPAPRDCLTAPHSIVGTVASDEVKIRLDLGKLLKRR